MRKYFLSLIAALASLAFSASAQKEKTSFQVADAWHEDYDVRADIAIVYGINDAGGKFEERVKSWRDRGYQVHFMTGIAWGQYQDYFMGKFDGAAHWDEGQVTKNGDTIWHGKHVPYIVPSASFLTYMKSHVKRAIDAGVTGIYLEEPEFWSRAGYSDSFKKEWEKFYGTPWRAQHESPEATYLSSKLKYRLYYNALKEVFCYIKTYSESKGNRVKCYVPTHSLLNYSAWQIVSPEASLASLDGMDGYIAQVWTGTAREPVYYNGVNKERVFENAFLEYGSMVSMTAPTGRKMFFLTDPIEDRARSWEDYKKNYEATFTAQLLYPMVADYEVMPWPPRIYRGRFKMGAGNDRQGISPEYATQMGIMVNSLNDMPLSTNTINGSKGIGVLLANSMMFQRFPTHADYSDPQLSNFYGMALPLLKRGVPVETVHMENLGNQNALKAIKVLVMSYSNMKPPAAATHEQLAAWVKKGGVLIYYGRDNDPFQAIKEWWNTGDKRFETPTAHLLQLLGIQEKPGTAEYRVGKGTFILVREDPKELVLTPGKDSTFIQHIKTGYENRAMAGKFISKNNLFLRRGPYDIAAALDEHSDKSPLVINGPVIDLFDPALPVLAQKNVGPGEQAFLYNISRASAKAPAVLASAARVTDEIRTRTSYSFLTKGPAKTNNVMRILLSRNPKSISLIKNGSTIPVLKNDWDTTSKTLLLSFRNFSEGVQVTIEW